jgi:hypothetical protein
MVASRRQRGRRLFALQDQAGVRLVRRQRDCRIQQRLVQHHPPGSSPHDAETITLGCASAMRAASSAGGEATEHHRVDRPQPCTGQHGDHRLGHHRQVDHDAVAARDAQRRQCTGELRHAQGQFGIAETHDLAGHRAVPDQRQLRAAAGGDVPIQAVVAGVQHGAWKPAAEWARGRIEHRVPAFVPGDALGGCRPPRLGLARPRAIGRVVARSAARFMPKRFMPLGVTHARPPGSRHGAPAVARYHPATHSPEPVSPP